MPTVARMLERIIPGYESPATRRARRAEEARALDDGTNMGRLRAMAAVHPVPFRKPTPAARRVIRDATRADHEAEQAARYRSGTVRRTGGLAVPARPALEDVRVLVCPQGHRARHVSDGG